MVTTDPNILAIGDIAGGTCWHTQGGQGGPGGGGNRGRGDGRVELELSSGGRCTDPEAAWVGLTEQEAKRRALPWRSPSSRGGERPRAHLRPVDGL